jgi:hypothetical protein
LSSYIPTLVTISRLTGDKKTGENTQNATKSMKKA